MSRSIVTALVAMVLLLAGCGNEEAALSGFERIPVPVVNGDPLPVAGADETPFEFAASDPDGLLVVYFGYTNCPDVCPTTLFDLRTALDALEETDRARIETAMVTIDPARDTAEILTGYVGSFLPTATAIRTDDDAELRRAADSFGVDYGVTDGDGGEIEVFHTGSLYAVNSTGQLLISWPFGVPAADITKDLAILIDRQAA